MTNPLATMSNEELATAIALPHLIEQEFMCRQTVAQQEAAQAAKETAIYTQQSARYMLVSVIVLALSSVGTFVLAFMTYAQPN